MKIKKYFVVKSSSLSVLMNEVNILIDQGWQPMGAVAVGMGSGWAEYLQTMVKL